MYFHFLFINFRLHWVFVAVFGLFSSCVKRGLLSSCSAWASRGGGFSCCRAWALGPAGSVLGLPCSGAQAHCCSSQALEHRLSVPAPGLWSTDSVVAAPGLWSTGSVVTAPGLWSMGSVLRLPGSGARAQCCGSRALEHGLSVAAPGLWSTGSVVVAHRLCCSLACGILLGKVLNPCLLCWQMNSLSLSHQGSSWLLDFIKCFFCVF